MKKSGAPHGKRAGSNVNTSANSMGLNDLVRSQTNLPARKVTRSKYHQRIDNVPRVGRDGSWETDSTKCEDRCNERNPDLQRVHAGWIRSKLNLGR